MHMRFLPGLAGLLILSQAVSGQVPPPKTAPATLPPVAPATTKATPSSVAAPAASAVAATVNGAAIPETAVARALASIPPQARAEARKEVLDYLVDNELIDQYLKQQKITVEAKEIDARLEEVRKVVKNRKQDFDKMLKEMLLTEADMRLQIAAEMRWEKFVNAQASDKVLQELYVRERAMFDGSKVSARHILLTYPADDTKARDKARADLLAYRKQVEDKAAQALAKLPPSASKEDRDKERTKATDEAFAALAKEKSACPSKEKGGDIGAFPRAGIMVEPFAKAAFALKLYEMSGVVTTQFGAHLILLTDRQPGKADLKFETIKEMVKDYYGAKLRDNLCGQLRKSAKVVVNPAPKG